VPERPHLLDDGRYIVSKQERVCDFEGDFVSQIVTQLTELAARFEEDPCLINEGSGYDEPEYYLTGFRLATPEEIKAEEARQRKMALSNKERAAARAAEKAASKARGDQQALERAKQAFPELFNQTPSTKE
jgi:hypothetical protein